MRYHGLVVLFLLWAPLLLCQNFTIILGRPTQTSITANIVFDRDVDFLIYYGTSPENLSQYTGQKSSKSKIPNVIELTGLSMNTQYSYQLHYKPTAASEFKESEIYHFRTQRAEGESFVFTIEADEHLYDKKGHAPLYEICLANQANDWPDFMISLGDTFGDDHTPEETTSEDMKVLHEDYLKYLSKISHSIPFFFCLGNHEGENGYYLNQNNGNNIAVYGTQWRKYYYPNPIPNEFYSGNMKKEGYGIDYPENYYAFTWGDAQIVVLDVYRDCDVNEKPQKWDWTIGEDQYRWFRKTLEESTSKYKLVFAHHTRGQGRGAAATVNGYEWGGYNNNKYEFDTYRPGWGKPIHQVMKDTGVDIFFQGHDHLFAWEKVDDIIYQEVPMPSDSSYKIGVTDNGDAYTDLILDGSGHLRVQVSPTCLKVDYIRAYLPKDTINGIHKNGETAYSYQLGDCTSQTHGVIENNFKSYPNPATFSNTLEFSEKIDATEVTLTLYDVQGKRYHVASQITGPNSIEMNTAFLAPGMYVIKIELRNKQAIYHKLIIQ